MYFSPTTSFAAALILGFASIYCIMQTNVSERTTFYPIALIPLFFAIQQLAEGLIWLHVQQAWPINLAVLKMLTYTYLGIAYLFWPVWIPLSLFIFDTKKRNLFLTMTVVGAIYSLSLLIHYLLHPTIVSLQVVKHSLAYFDNATTLSWSMALYLLLTVGALLLASWTELKILGLIIAISAVIAFSVYSYTFVSVWSFFAGVVSAYICRLAYLIERKYAEIN